ncbi:5600_t:CDS:2 [Ambispora gerdemannii]|uniref:5600_t:CDS:1 n=1 Tax=Ambispora gerdemannii TaxID=144530 RepID=A0A9N8VDY3_9GLOM|nr:5600_t:CDS:2 [Ambispora gerdemannii]
MSSTKVAVITGANSGVGFGTAQRLLQHSENNPTERIKLVLACRNPTRAANARSALLKKHPKSDIDIVIVDVSLVKSVLACCAELKKKYRKVNWLFCNAGILACDYVDFGIACKELIVNPKRLLTETRCVIQPKGCITSEGLGETFACNIFGHYVMIHELEDLLAASEEARIIWTGSSTSAKGYYNAQDYQGLISKFPYEASKYMADLIAIALNSRMNYRNIYTFVTHPGVVATDIMKDHLNWFMAKAMHTALYMSRFLGVNEQTVTSWNGSFSNYYVATSKPTESLKLTVKYGSYIKPWGTIYVHEDPMDYYDEKEAQDLLNKLDALLAEFLIKYRS